MASGLMATATYSNADSTEIVIPEADRLILLNRQYEEPMLFVSDGKMAVRWSRRDSDDCLCWEDVVLNKKQVAKLRALLAKVK
jgi:hypothetical protein